MTSSKKIGAAYECDNGKQVVTIQSRGKEMIVREFNGRKTFTVKPSQLKLTEKLINGIGVVGDEATKEGGVILPSFVAWRAMIERVYTKKGEQRSGKRVCDSWLRYRNFKWWYNGQRKSLKISDSMAGVVVINGRSKIYKYTNCKLVAFLSEPTPKKRIHIMKPDGSMTTTTNLKQFCKRQNLQLNLMYQVIKGTLHQHKGYRRWS